MAKVAPQGKAPVPLVPDIELRKNEWEMVTLTFDGSGAVLFLNGTEISRQDCTDTAYWNAAVSLTAFNIAMFRMGGSFYSPPTLNAIIDDASCWKKALSAKAIKSLYNHTKTENDTLNENNTDGPASELISDPIKVAEYAPEVSASDRCIVGASRGTASGVDYHNSKAGNWLESHNALAAEMEADSTAGIIFIGDSITNRWESDDGIGAWNVLKEKYGRLVNLGIGGDGTQNVIWRLEQGEYPEGVTTDYVMLLIGTNNTGGLSNANSIAAGAAKIIEIVHGRSPNAAIILFSILPRNWNNDNAGFKASRPPLIRQVNEILAGYDGYSNVQYYDLGQFFVNQDGSLNNGLFTDGLHLNSDGYGIWKDKIIEILTN
jgi:beta-glucosidase